MEFKRLQGLVAAVHTPMHSDGSLNLDAIDKQAAFMLSQGISWVFVGGSTGESHSLSLDERMALSERWSQVRRGSDLGMVVHVGCNSLADARSLSAHAQKLGADAWTMRPDQFAEYLREEIRRNEALVKAAGLAPQ